MIDYSESLIKINYLRKKAHESILDKRWPDACDYLDEIVVAAREAKMFCLDKRSPDACYYLGEMVVAAREAKMFCLGEIIEELEN